MKKIVTLFSILMLMFMGIPSVNAQGGLSQQDQIINSVDEVTYNTVKDRCREIQKLLDLSEKQFDMVLEIMLHVEVKRTNILNTATEDAKDKLLSGVKRYELQNLGTVLDERQLIMYQEWSAIH